MFCFAGPSESLTPSPSLGLITDSASGQLIGNAPANKKHSMILKVCWSYHY